MNRIQYIASGLMAAALSLALNQMACAQSQHGEAIDDSGNAGAGNATNIAVGNGVSSTETLRPEVGQLLRAARDLMIEGKYQAALEKVREADAIPDKTPYETLTADRMRGAAAANLGDTALALKSFDAVIENGRLSAAEQLTLIEAVANTHYRAKEYDKAGALARRYLALGGANEQIHALLIQSLYLQGDYADAIKELNAEIQTADKAGRPPSEEHLKLLARSYQKLNDTVGYTSALEHLAATYPKKEYWTDLISRVETRPSFPDYLFLETYRLKLATGTLTDTNDFMNMAQLLMLAGLPAEAKTVMEKGYASGVLGSGPTANRQKQLRDQVNKQAADDAKSPGEGEAQAKAARSGDGLMNIGYNYVANGQLGKGIALMEQALTKGGLKRPEIAKLHLGVSYLQAGNKARAEEILRTVQGADGTAELARLWLLV